MRAGSQKPSSASSSRLRPSSPPLPTTSVSGSSALCEEWRCLLPKGLRGVPRAIAQPPRRRQAQPGPLLKCTAAAPHFARIPCGLKNQVRGHWRSTRGPSLSSPLGCFPPAVRPAMSPSGPAPGVTWPVCGSCSMPVLFPTSTLMPVLHPLPSKTSKL